MATDRISTDVNYLTNAAHLLRQSAPNASAHLMRQRNELMFYNNLTQQETQSQHVCGACGHIMVPGDGTSIKLKRNIKRATRQKWPLQENPGSLEIPGGRTKIVECGLCHRATRISLEPPERVVRRKMKQSSQEIDKSHSGGATEAQAKPSANASSKKRAKNRKGGLQALLANQQQRSAGSLSLADFMK